MKERTEAQRMAFSAAADKNRSLEGLTNEAISSGIFMKAGKNNGSYSLAWILGRLRLNDDRVSKKLIEFANTL